MHGSSYIWGFLVPASILLFVGFYLSAQLSGAVKLTAALQIDQRARNKIIKRRGLQIGLFFKVSTFFSTPCLLHTKVECHKDFISSFVTTAIKLSVSMTFLIKIHTRMPRSNGIYLVPGFCRMEKSFWSWASKGATRLRLEWWKRSCLWIYECFSHSISRQSRLVEVSDGKKPINISFSVLMTPPYDYMLTKFFLLPHSIFF